MQSNGSAIGAVEQFREEARSYYALCDRAARAGVPVSLDDPRSPTTVAALRDAVEKAEAS